MATARKMPTTRAEFVVLWLVMEMLSAVAAAVRLVCRSSIICVAEMVVLFDFLGPMNGRVNLELVYNYLPKEKSFPLSGEDWSNGPRRIDGGFVPSTGNFPSDRI